MNATEFPRPHAVWGTLKARDARSLIDFLVERFGFIETAVFADGEGVGHAQLDWPEGGGIMLGDSREGEVWALAPGSAGFYVSTDRVVEIYAAVRSAGVEIVRELVVQEGGNHELAVRDPEGNLWSFGTYTGEPRVGAAER